MLPSWNLIYKCPQCRYRFEVAQAGSGFVPFTHVWSDGYVEGGGYFPPEMVRCGNCYEMLWLIHIEPIAKGFPKASSFGLGFPPLGIGNNPPDKNLEDTGLAQKTAAEAPPQKPRLPPIPPVIPISVSLDSRFKNAVESFPETTWFAMREEDFDMALASGFFATPTDEIKLRIWIWQQHNHALRNDNGDEKPSFSLEKSERYRENMKQLLVLLLPGNPHFRPLLRAELFRNLGQFELAIREAETAQSVERWRVWDSERNVLLEHCRQQDPYPFVFS